MTNFADVIYARLEFLGLPVDINQWHLLQERASKNQLCITQVNVDVDQMSNKQVVAFVRKHGAQSPAAMMVMWGLHDRMTCTETSHYFEGTTLYDTWRVAAHMINGMESQDACDHVYDQIR